MISALALATVCAVSASAPQTIARPTFWDTEDRVSSTNELSPHPDHLGSTQYVTDVDGELYEHVQYFPSGEPWIRQDTNTERLPYLFTSQELDQETGLYYFNARYYDPRDGVFISTDPAAPRYLDGAPNLGVYLPQNQSCYAYAWNNPVVVSDPSGECPWCAAVATGAGIGGIIGGGLEAARQVASGEPINLRRIGAATIGGAVTGALMVATGGTATSVQAAAVGTGIAIAEGRIVEDAINNEPTDPVAVAQESLFGALLGGATFRATPLTRAAREQQRHARIIEQLGERHRRELARRFGSNRERVRLLERVITPGGGINTSNTVARQLARGGERADIPTQSILDTIGSGVRTPDPQGVPGQFMFTAEATRNGSTRTLEVLVHEASGQIRHVLRR